MIKLSGMTVNSDTSAAMTSPSVPHSLQQHKTTRVSNFSVDSLLADNRPKMILSKAHLTASVNDSFTTNISITSPQRHQSHDRTLNDSSSSTSNSTSKNERHTPHSSASAESDVEYDSNPEDDDDNSDVDIEAGMHPTRDISFYPFCYLYWEWSGSIRFECNWAEDEIGYIDAKKSKQSVLAKWMRGNCVCVLCVFRLRSFQCQ